MPGTIHVSVLGFSDLPSTSSTSVIFKVSMGKIEYQTLDKGDFSFPVKSLREKLNLVVLDDAGSKICQTVIEAILVVQKGQWDDYFSLDDGGRVRLRLQFVLSDEERVKIRKMRESALQKKRSQLLITHPEFQRSIILDDVRGSDNSVDILSNRNNGNEAAKNSPVRDTVSFSSTQVPIQEENKEGDEVKKEQVNPLKDDRERTEEAMSPSMASDAATIHTSEVNTTFFVENQEVDKKNVDKSPGALNFKLSTFGSKGKLFSPKVDEEVDTKVNEGKLRKTPSSVRNMISAFEFNTTQDTKPRNKPPPLKNPISKLEFENQSNDLIADEVIVEAATEKLAEMSSEIVVSPSFFSELRQKVLAKKRQISYDVVEIITVAPERVMAEASDDELATEPPETTVSAFDGVDRFEVMEVDMRIYDIPCYEDDTRVTTVETRDNWDVEHMDLDNEDTEFFNVKTELTTIETIEKDSSIGLQSDSVTECEEPPREQTINPNDESEIGDSSKDILLVTEDGSDPENDRAATVPVESYDDDICSTKQVALNETHSELLETNGRDIEMISEKKPPTEDPKHVNKGTVSSKKSDNSEPLIDEPLSSWVFPEESRVPCIAPSSIHLTNSIGGCKVESNINALEHSMHSAGKPCRDRKTVNESTRSPGENDPASDGNPRGHFPQAIKIAIMVAFGALVFFSRQRNPR